MRKHIFTVITLIALVLCASTIWAKKSTTIEGVLNVNTASAEELMLLPGVGAVKASQIIEARSQKPFEEMEDLLIVKGIGEKTIEKWVSYVVFEGDTSIKIAEANQTE